MLGSADIAGQVVIADLEAGIGTLTRMAAGGVDAVVIVVEPTAKSIEVGRRALALARERSLGTIVVVANSLQGEEDGATVARAFADAGVEVVAVPHDTAILAAERDGTAPLDTAPDSPAVLALSTLADRLLPAAS